MNLEAFREELEVLKKKHLGDLKTLTEPQLKLVLNALIEGVHKAEYPEYRMIMGLMVGGKDRLCVVHEKVANLRIYDAKTGETINVPRYKQVQRNITYKPA